jgi:hypothetical protein
VGSSAAPPQLKEAALFHGRIELHPDDGAAPPGDLRADRDSGAPYHHPLPLQHLTGDLHPRTLTGKIHHTPNLRLVPGIDVHRQKNLDAPVTAAIVLDQD